MFGKSRLKQIQDRILDIQKENIADCESVGNSANVRKEKRRAEIADLESKRNFILDSKSDWISKFIWYLLMPIVVIIVATYALEFLKRF